MSVQVAVALFASLMIGISTLVLVLAVRRDRKAGDLKTLIRKEIRKNFYPQRRFTVDAFGMIEKSFPNLSEVIVVCHMVEDPSTSLREAVLDNFKEGVRYRFCVSKSNYAAAQRTYEAYFRAIFEVAKSECAKDTSAKICNCNFDELYRVTALKSEWEAWPYVFFSHLDDQGEGAVTAFRGDQEKEGIAENYVRLQPGEAKAILNAVNMATVDTNTPLGELVISATFDAEIAGIEAA